MAAHTVDFRNPRYSPRWRRSPCYLWLLLLWCVIRGCGLVRESGSATLATTCHAQDDEDEDDAEEDEDAGEDPAADARPG